MKQILIAITIIGGIMQSQLKAEEWEIDIAHSSIGFAVKHMMISTVRGEFKNYSATVQYDEKKPEASQFEAKIDVASVDTRNSQRDDHLRSADFFDASNHPQMIFKSKSVKKIANNKYQVIGDLTIRGVTKTVTLEGEGFSPVLKNPWGQMVTAVSAATTINRKDFGLTWNTAIEAGGVLVGEDVKIELNIELVKKS